MMPNDPLFGLIHDVQQRFYGFDALVQKAEEVNTAARIAADINPCAHHLAAMDAVTRVAAEISPCAHQLAAMDAVTRVAETLNPTTRHLEEMDAVARARERAALPEDPMQWINDLRIPVDRIETHLSDFSFPELPESRTPAELERMSDDEIANFLSGNVSITTTMLAVRELKRRQLNQVTRPHWSVSWTFWLVLISTIVGIIGVIVGVIGIHLMLR